MSKKMGKKKNTKTKKTETKKETKKTKTRKVKLLDKEALEALKSKGRVRLSAKREYFAGKSIPKTFRYVYNPTKTQIFISSLGKTIAPNEIVDLNVLEPSKKKRDKAISGDLRNIAERGMVFVFRKIDEVKEIDLPVSDVTPPLEKVKETRKVVGEDGIKEGIDNRNPFIEQLEKEHEKEEKEIEKVTRKAKKQ